MDKIYAIAFWVYVVSMLGAAFYTTLKMNEIQEAWLSTDPAHKFAPYGVQQLANFFIAGLFVFTPLVNTVTAFTMLVVVLHKIINRE